jgi:cyclopropane fatty-acyl-phospholipid synthase-like methyltransferase
MLRAQWDLWNEQWATTYPHEKVIRFCLRTFPLERRRFVDVLDLGCGSGAHTVFLAAEGFRVTGLDISSVGLAKTKARLEALGLRAHLKQASADALDFSPASFDLVVCVGVYDSAGLAVARSSVPQVSDILRPGGRGFFLFATDRDEEVRQDKEWGMHGFTRQEVDEMFGGRFAHVDVDSTITTFDNGRFEQSEWLVTVTR